MSHTSEHIPAGIARRSRSSCSYDRFGRFAERLVRAFGMPWFLAAQTAVIVAWVVANSLAGLPHFDAYPFIFLNLVFSALAAYAAPFILLAETRQADRDRARARAEERHHDELERRQQELLEQDNSQTQQIARLLEQDTAQTEHLAELLEQVRLLLERSDRSDRCPSPSRQDRRDGRGQPGAHARDPLAHGFGRTPWRPATDESRRFRIRCRLLAGPHAGSGRRTEQRSMRPRDGGRLIVRRPDFDTNPTENWRTERCSSTSLSSSW
jgi:uncharacterized membrane protein